MPSNSLCKLQNLSDALPTLHELIVINRRWAVPSNPLCKQINLTDALPTLHELIVVSGQRSAVSGQRSEPVGGMGILPVSFPTGCFNQALRG
ncbi:MAG: hypothetical protein F6J90_26335 [Moorea sp. SIOASIH]|uniref:hypothetical protein n=1 Tax=Moorena sp. SIOASIH TaxID=2607817 RepID=UPI0013B8A078|nr:hypothetical protein [Moorena sp. SIOASIH]NEO39659.1 hypothetical protein [Moorena sp. SIOASIH]